jgi:MATE family multidrug resistance protein
MMFALVSANLVNAAGNWVFIYGHLGMPALGVEGSAWATTGARVYMAAFLLLAIRRVHRQRHHRHPRVPVVFDRDRIGTLVRIGFPAASQVALEVGVFAAATAMAGKLEPVVSGAHQIALNIAGLAFMLPLGLSSASAVRVGHAYGARDIRRAVSAGWTALAAGCAIMLTMGAVFLIWARPLLHIFTHDPAVVEIGVRLLTIAAAFQLFDGTQAVVTGILRGLGETRTTMIVNVVGHWCIGLPIGYILCFRRGWSVTGLWIGLSIGLVLVALVLTLEWWKRTRILLRTS